MAREPGNEGLGGPQRPRSAGPAPRARADEPTAGRGAAYSAPPPAEPPSSKGPAPLGRWWIAGGLIVFALAGGFLFRGGPAMGPSPAPAAVAVQAARVLHMTSADVDLVATDLARRLIAEGGLPAPPQGVSPSAAPDASSGSPQPEPAVAPASPSASGPAAAPVAPAPAPAPVVHRPRRPAAAPRPAVPDPAPAVETEQAVRQVLAQAPTETREAIASGKTVIYTMHVLDDVAEDGDVVEVFVNGQSHGTVALTSAGQDLLIPLPAGSSASVHVVALQDGGGGVTFGVVTSLGELRSTVMPVGGSDDWSVSTP